MKCLSVEFNFKADCPHETVSVVQLFEGNIDSVRFVLKEFSQSLLDFYLYFLQLNLPPNI